VPRGRDGREGVKKYLLFDYDCHIVGRGPLARRQRYELLARLDAAGAGRDPRVVER
jgi:hypothetical protein